MYLLLPLEGQAVFGAYNYDEVVRIPADNREQLFDIALSIWGKPQSITIPNVGPSGTPRDTRVYFDGEDISSAVLTVLRTNLDSMDQNELGNQYYRAMERFLEMEQQLGLSSAAGKLQEAENRAKALAAQRPVSVNLDRLGSRGLGAFHNLHLFNFLFTEVAAPAVSLRAILEAHHQGGGAEIILGSRAHTLVFSAGPCRLFAQGPWPVPTVDLLGGVLRYRLALQYKNPLEEVLQSLQDAIGARLDEISAQIGSNGLIMRHLLPEIDRELVAIETDLNTTNAALSGQSQQVSSLANSVTDLRTAVEHL